MPAPTALYDRVQTDTWLHRAPARGKLVGLVTFVVIVVATPREWLFAFAGYGVFVVCMLVLSRTSPIVVLKRSLIEAPFVVFALLMPLIAQGPRVDVWGMSLSVDGLWAASAILTKATIALLASIALVATTEPRRIVMALESLHLPRQLVSIMGFMLRYLDLIAEDYSRMRTARVARGFRAAGPRGWRIIASGVAALFIRSHARGERIHLAMLARGYSESGAE